MTAERENETDGWDWLFKCRQCKHYYQVQADADEVRCRLKYCKYEPIDEIKEFHELQKELAFIAESGDKG